MCTPARHVAEQATRAGRRVCQRRRFRGTKQWRGEQRSGRLRACEKFVRLLRVPIDGCDCVLRDEIGGHLPRQTPWISPQTPCLARRSDRSRRRPSVSHALSGPRHSCRDSLHERAHPSCFPPGPRTPRVACVTSRSRGRRTSQPRTASAPRLGMAVPRSPAIRDGHEVHAGPHHQSRRIPHSFCKHCPRSQASNSGRRAARASPVTRKK
jgi:hypothetical protein